MRLTFHPPEQMISTCSDPLPLLMCLLMVGCIFPSSPAVGDQRASPSPPTQAQDRAPKSVGFTLLNRDFSNPQKTSQEHK